MAKIKLDSAGNKFYYNDDGQIHREGGPAIIHSNGNCYWGKFNIYCNDVGPSFDYPNGYKKWQITGQRNWPKL